MDNGKSAILKMLQDAGKEPHLHDEWIAEWREHYNQLENSTDSSSDFSQIEHAALGSLSNVRVKDTHPHLNTEVCQMLDRFKHTTLLVEANGTIAARNTMAQTSFGLNAGDNIADLHLSLDEAETLHEVIRSTLASGNANDGASFKKAYSSNSSHEYILAITKSTGINSSAALVFVVSPQFSTNFENLVKTQYDLTTAECQVLVHFVKGYSLNEIASIRCRSKATVRTQFNSLLTKMGAHSQASLLRTAFSLSDFVTEIDKFSDVLEHPYRNRTRIMRPNGRMLEVCFCGDPTGTPVLHIPHSAGHQYSAAVEEELYKAAINFVTVSPPGYGKSDSAAEGDDRESTWVNDVKAVLLMLGVERCPVLVTSAGTYRAFRLALLMPESISRIVLVGAVPPGKNWLKHGTASPWIDAVLRVSTTYPTLKKVINYTGLKAWVAVGTEHFFRLQFSKSENELKVLTTPENMAELEAALDNSTRHSFKYLLEDIAPLLDDYTDTVKNTQCDISVIHGVEDTGCPYKAMVDFKNEFPNRVQITRIEDAGFAILLSHTSKVCELLRSLLYQDSANQSEKRTVVSIKKRCPNSAQNSKYADNL